MSVMTAQPPLPIATDPSATPVGDAAALVEDQDGGRVFLHGNLVYAWQPGEDALRRWSAVQLARLGAAPVAHIATAFGVDPGTLWRWGQALTRDGVTALASDKRGPKGPHRLTEPVVARIQALRADRKSHRAIATQVGVSETSVRRVLGTLTPDIAGPDAVTPDTVVADTGLDDEPERAQPAAPAPVLPVLPPAVDRSGERAAARFGLLSQASPVFAPAARVPLAGLLLAMPALAATGLLWCARSVFGALPNGFYGLDTVLVEAVLRSLAGEPRAQGATRVDPVALGRVLGLDRAPEVKTIRRKIATLAGTGQAGRLIAAMAATHLARTDTGTTTTSTSTGTGTGADPDDPDAVPVGMVLYVDGHVRAYQGGRKVAKTHLARLRFPAPATVETWVSDAAGAPVLVVLAEPGASLAGELRRLLPQLRAAVGDDRRVLVGFDRGGWSPALFAHLHEHGFDVLTWRRGPAQDIAPDRFTDLAFTDETGRTHQWRAADTTITLPLAKPSTKASTGSDGHADGAENKTKDRVEVKAEHEYENEDRTEDGVQDAGKVFAMRQVTLAVPTTKHGKKHGSRRGAGGSDLRQIHILTTRTDLPAEQVIYRMGSRWRQENYFRYARMHFDLDSHDCYAAHEDDPDRSVPNPARKHTYQALLAARARHGQQAARTDAALLAARSPAPGTPTLLTNQAHDAITADLREAEAALTAAEAAHEATPARLPLHQVNPGQQVLDIETKLINHAIRIAAFNTASTLVRELRVHTGYARANHEAHALIRQVLTGSGDLDPSIDGVLTVRLDPLPTRRATAAIAQLCEHLTTTETRYPGTDLILRYEIKTAP
ncbi:putative transposase [Amycolatopsis sp.]|uniref:putative transposase n=1 Tax=Amycolatopsis sp. TaxID=37632 RepID=UPI002D8042D5|nr:hypothetical protein [Amycolatopsis sp.]HET6704513.1 hypothetical protein [Amycolatopsis sp.]